MSGPLGHSAGSTLFFPSSRGWRGCRTGNQAGSIQPEALSSVTESSIARSSEAHMVAGTIAPGVSQWALGSSLSVGCEVAGSPSVLVQTGNNSHQPTWCVCRMLEALALGKMDIYRLIKCM